MKKTAPTKRLACSPDLVGAAAAGAATKKTGPEEGQKAQQRTEQLEKEPPSR